MPRRIQKAAKQNWDPLALLHESGLLKSLRMSEFVPKFSPFDIYEKIVPEDPEDARWYPYESNLTKKLHNEISKSKYGHTIVISSVAAFLKYSPEIADIQITDPEKTIGFIRYKDQADLPRNLEIKDDQKVVYFSAKTVRETLTRCVFEPIYRVAGGRVGADDYVSLENREEEFMNETEFIKKYDLYIAKYYAFLIRKGDFEYLVQKFDKVLIEPILIQDMIYQYHKSQEVHNVRVAN